MEVRYVGHACLSIEVEGQRVLTDPWWNGAAYTGQWYQYPDPRVERADQEDVDFVFISHGHEDHLHIPTLRAIDKKAKLVIPRYRDPAMASFLNSLGFAGVIEIGHGETCELSPGLAATVYINKDDSILVLEGDGQTLVNANDALHASSRHVIDHFAEQIRQRHERIDLLFVGYGGASWFPNCMQMTDAPEFDATWREEVFAQNFAYIARQLKPVQAFPFAASFVLLEEHLCWINAVRLGMASPIEELRRQGEHDVLSHHLLPGDCIADGRFERGPLLHKSVHEAEAEIRTLYATQLAEIVRKKALDEERIEQLLSELRSNAAKRAHRVLRNGHHIACRIDLRDMPEVSFIVDARRGHVRIDRCDRMRTAPMILTTRLEVLEAWAMQAFGYEAITIGYGATLQLQRRDMCLRAPLLNLLGRKPLRLTRTETLALWLTHPWRCIDTWRRDLHWRRLRLRVRQGKVQRWNDIYALDPERWSPLRDRPLQRSSA